MAELTNKVTYALEDFRKYYNDDDYEFAYATVDFLSTRPNTHKHIYTEDVIKQYADTVLGKWVIGEYNSYTKDFKSHTKNQVIIGMVLQEQEIKYRYDDDGYLIASVDVVISKLYANEMYEALRKKGVKSVSIEELVGFVEEDEDIIDGMGEKRVIGFNICGITVLGDKINPSVPNAKITLTKLSEDSIAKMNEEYVMYSKINDTISMQDIMDKLDNIESKLDKEVVMSKLNQEEILNDVEMSEVENENKDNDINTEVEMEEQEQVDDNDDEEVVENSVCEDEEKSACDTEKMAELESKLSEMEIQLNSANDKIAEYEAKIVEYEAEVKGLKEFKETTEMSKRDAIVSETLAQVKEYVEAEAYSNFFESGKVCAYNDINAWRNEVLASASSKMLEKIAQMSAQDEEDIMEMGSPKETEVKTSIFD